MVDCTKVGAFNTACPFVLEIPKFIFNSAPTAQDAFCSVGENVPLPLTVQVWLSTDVVEVKLQPDAAIGLLN